MRLPHLEPLAPVPCPAAQSVVEWDPPFSWVPGPVLSWCERLTWLRSFALGPSVPGLRCVISGVLALLAGLLPWTALDSCLKSLRTPPHIMPAFKGDKDLGFQHVVRSG